jgi:hypothetical protein
MVSALASFSIDTTLVHPSYRYFRIELRRVVAADLALFLYVRYRRKSAGRGDEADHGSRSHSWPPSPMRNAMAILGKPKPPPRLLSANI